MINMTSEVILDAIKSKKAKQCKRLVSAKPRQHFTKPESKIRNVSIKHDQDSKLKELYLYNENSSARNPATSRHRARSALTANRRNTFHPP